MFDSPSTRGSIRGQLPSGCDVRRTEEAKQGVHATACVYQPSGAPELTAVVNPFRETGRDQLHLIRVAIALPVLLLPALPLVALMRLLAFGFVALGVF